MKFFIDPYTKGTVQIPDKRHNKSIQFLISGYDEVDWSQYLAQVKDNIPKIIEKKDDGSGYFMHRKYWDETW